jgi:hypothetical protein
MTAIDGNTLEGVSATTLWTLHNHGSEAKRSDGVIRDPWAVTLLDAIDYDYLKFGKPNQSHGLRAVALGLIRDCAARFPGGRMMFDSIPRWFSKRTPMPFGQTVDEALALACTIPGVKAARDVPWPPGRGWWKLAAWPPLDRIGPLRRIRPSNTVLEFA